MELTPYVDRLRSDLLAAAEAGGADVTAAAERLTLALDSAVRMSVLEALSDAAAEVTQQLPHAVVEVRIKGRDPQFAVTLTEPDDDATQVLPGETGDSRGDADESDDGAVARITVRLPESVKVRAEEVAARSGQSLNAWIVQAMRLATRERAVNVDIDLSSFPFGPGSGSRRNRRVQGWAR